MKSQDMSIEEIFDLILKGGDPDKPTSPINLGFNELVRTRGIAMEGYIVKRSRQVGYFIKEDEIREVIQIIFHNIFKGIKNLKNKDHLDAWVWMVARNALSTWGRKNKNYAVKMKNYKDELKFIDTEFGVPEENEELELEMLSNEDDELFSSNDAETLFDDESDSSEEITPHYSDTAENCVQNVIQELKSNPNTEASIKETLSVIEDFYFDGYSIKEISARLGKTANAVKTFLYESRKKLAPYLLPCSEAA